MILTYLAIVERRKTLQSPGKLQLVAMRGINGIWVAFKEVVSYGADKGFNEGVLVLVEVNDKRQILKMEAAAEEIVRNLVFYSSEIKKQEQETESWRHSIDFQVVELAKRKKELDEREDLIRLQEEAIKQFNKANY